MNSLLEKIKAFAARQDIPVYGTGRTSELEKNSPQGYRPSDLLSSAKGLVCLGVPVPKGIFRCTGKENETYWRAANIAYRSIDAMLMQMARTLEESGELALPVFG